jgi:DNA-binding MarR family transcriptional regulator
LVTTVSPDTRTAQEVDALALELVDAILAGDTATLQAKLAELRSARSEAVTGLISTAQWALERLPSSESVAHGTQAWHFLSELQHGSRGSSELRPILGVDETQVSRTGRRLLDAGLVTRRKTGRSVSWELTPRGQKALAAATDTAPRRAVTDAGAPGADVDWWRGVIRNAWRAPAAGHESGDPMTDRILDAAYNLHNEKGIIETTWPDIAARAGVPVAEVDARFATLEDLVPACGGLSLTKVQLPPPERAAELFEGQGRDERLRTLVSILFDMYERGAMDLRVMRRESARLPMVANARAAAEEARDALIAAALAPDDDPGSVALVRALTDLSAWEGFRAGRVSDGDVADLIASARAAAAAA